MQTSRLTVINHAMFDIINAVSASLMTRNSIVHLVISILLITYLAIQTDLLICPVNKIRK